MSSVQASEQAGGGVALAESNGLAFEIAQGLADVEDAWSLLYRAYVRAGLIEPNDFSVHTVPEAIGRETAVVVGRIGGLAVSTISAIGDSPRGLPLDSVYKAELDQMRAEGRRLVEVGLFGDRRDPEGDRAFTTIFELMRFVFWYAIHDGYTDMLCGIHPRRARLYGRAFGFHQVGEAKSYSTVNDAPVVLMRADRSVLSADSTHRAIVHFLESPVDRSFFDGRYAFEPSELNDSRVGQFLLHHG